MPESELFSSGGALPAAFEAVLAAHAQHVKASQRVQAEAEERVAHFAEASAEAQAAVASFTAALRRVTYRADEPVPMDFLAAMDDAASTTGTLSATGGAHDLVPGGRDATEVLGGFLCDVEADRQARGTLEAQLRVESTRAEDCHNAVEALQVRKSAQVVHVPLFVDTTHLRW